VEVFKMKKFIVLLLVGAVLFYSVPSYAVAGVLSAIPDDYYIHFFAGAALQGLLGKHDVSPTESIYITIGIALAKETIDSAIFGGKFDLAEAGVTVLGATVMNMF
jgi:hypothetical protein